MKTKPKNETWFKEQIVALADTRSDCRLVRYGIDKLRGRPDIIGTLPGGRSVYIEAKIDGNTATGLQKYTLYKFRQVGAAAVILRFKNSDNSVAIYEPISESEVKLTRTLDINELCNLIDIISSI